MRLSTAKKADIVTFLAYIYLSIVPLFCDQFAAYQLTLVLYWTPLEDRLDCASDESNSLSVFFRNHFRSRRDELEWESSCMAQDPEWLSDLAISHMLNSFRVILTEEDKLFTSGS